MLCSTHPTQAKADRLKPAVFSLSLNLGVENQTSRRLILPPRMFTSGVLFYNGQNSRDRNIAGAMPKNIPQPQAVISPVTPSAIFIVATLAAGGNRADKVRALCGNIAALIRAVGRRVPSGNLSCVFGFSSGGWDKLFGEPRPVSLHPFREFRTDDRHAMATPGDLLLHIRADRMDLCFELAMQALGQLGDAVSVADEVHGFRYFDLRSMVGFVDGTENPAGQEAVDFTIIGDEDAAFAGGSYVLVQKYLHDMAGWNSLSVEAQECVMGRTKLSDIELEEGIKPSSSHSSLTTIAENGKEIKILRDNMPFGRPGAGEFGTYFIGYARSPAPIEQMLENMFVGRPPGNYDRLLDHSRAVTGGLFFVPSADLLEALAERNPQASGASRADSVPSVQPHHDGSLNIGSLKGNSQYE